MSPAAEAAAKAIEHAPAARGAQRSATSTSRRRTRPTSRSCSCPPRACTPRRCAGPGLVEALQREYRVMLAGPTTLLATAEQPADGLSHAGAGEALGRGLGGAGRGQDRVRQVRRGAGQDAQEARGGEQHDRRGRDPHPRDGAPAAQRSRPCPKVVPQSCCRGSRRGRRRTKPMAEAARVAAAAGAIEAGQKRKPPEAGTSTGAAAFAGGGAWRAGGTTRARSTSGVGAGCVPVGAAAWIRAGSRRRRGRPCHSVCGEAAHRLRANRQAGTRAAADHALQRLRRLPRSLRAARCTGRRAAAAGGGRCRRGCSRPTRRASPGSAQTARRSSGAARSCGAGSAASPLRPSWITRALPVGGRPVGVGDAAVGAHDLVLRQGRQCRQRQKGGGQCGQGDRLDHDGSGSSGWMMCESSAAGLRTQDELLLAGVHPDRSRAPAACSSDGAGTDRGLGRLQRVDEQHRDRHRPDAAGHGRDPAGDLANGSEIDIATELARSLRFMPTSMTTAPGLTMSAVSMLRRPTAATTTSAPARVQREVGRGAVADRDRGVGLQQQQRHRLAHRVAAADHHRMLAAQVHARCSRSASCSRRAWPGAGRAGRSSARRPSAPKSRRRPWRWRSPRSPCAGRCAAAAASAPGCRGSPDRR